MTVVIHVEGGMGQAGQAGGSGDVPAIVYDVGNEENEDNTVVWFPVDPIETQRFGELAACANGGAWTVVGTMPALPAAAPRGESRSRRPLAWLTSSRALSRRARRWLFQWDSG